ncbi:hypothetical protein HOK31_02100 [Candidatus Poribacteria bacterium]|nr:hypothetical protein [Candidatus Poribacteria bacterium]
MLLLSPVFGPAHARLAAIYEGKGDLDRAIHHLHSANLSNRNDVFGIDQELQDTGARLRESLRLAATRDSADVLRRGTLEAAMFTELGIVEEWYAAARDDETSGRVDHNLRLLSRRRTTRQPQRSQPPPELASPYDAGAADFDRELVRHGDLLAMAVAAGKPGQAAVYNAARWRRSQTNPPTDQQRVLDELVGAPTATRDEVELAQAFVLIGSDSPRHANNLAAVYARHGFLEAAIRTLYHAIEMAATTRGPETAEQRRGIYGDVVHNLSLCYEAMLRHGYAGELEKIAAQLQ